MSQLYIALYSRANHPGTYHWALVCSEDRPGSKRPVSTFQIINPDLDAPPSPKLATPPPTPPLITTPAILTSTKLKPTTTTSNTSDTSSWYLHHQKCPLPDSYHPGTFLGCVRLPPLTAEVGVHDFSDFISEYTADAPQDYDFSYKWSCARWIMCILTDLATEHGPGLISLTVDQRFYQRVLARAGDLAEVAAATAGSGATTTTTTGTTAGVGSGKAKGAAAAVAAGMQWRGVSALDGVAVVDL